MNKLKNLLILLLLAGFCTTPIHIWAQDVNKKDQKKEMAEKRMKEFSEKLKLSDQQQAQLKSIMKGQRVAMKDARSKTDKAERKKAVAVVLKDSDAKIKAILDDEQKKKYEELKAQKKAEMKKKMEERKEADLEDEGIF